MSASFADLRPPYPQYQSQPMFGGDLPSIDQIGPPDLRPSSLNPFYDVYRGAHGRNFAGLGASEMQTADIGLKTYANELDTLAQADDIQGNGVFDPNGTQGNINADFGVFADHESLPGYIVRDQFYEPSEVIDGTTGEPVLFVPSGAVAIDQAQRDAIRSRQLLWELPPGVSPQPITTPDFGESWIPQEYAWPVSGLGADALTPADATTKPKVPIVAAFAIVGMAVGIFAATLMKR